MVLFWLFLIPFFLDMIGTKEHHIYGDARCSLAELEVGRTGFVRRRQDVVDEEELRQPGRRSPDPVSRHVVEVGEAHQHFQHLRSNRRE